MYSRLFGRAHHAVLPTKTSLHCNQFAGVSFFSSVLVPRFPLFSCVAGSPGFHHGVVVGGEFLVYYFS